MNMNNKIFVGNVPFECDINDFRNCFRHIQGYKNADLINMRGFGFVEFTDVEARNKAMKMNNFYIKNRRLRLNPYDIDLKARSDESMYIKLENISQDVSRDDIIKEFKNICDIGKCFIDSDRQTGRKLTTGIVEVIDKDIYQQLINLGSLLMHDNSEMILKPYGKQKKIIHKEISYNHNN